MKGVSLCGYRNATFLLAEGANCIRLYQIKSWCLIGRLQLWDWTVARPSQWMAVAEKP